MADSKTMAVEHNGVMPSPAGFSVSGHATIGLHEILNCRVVMAAVNFVPEQFQRTHDATADYIRSICPPCMPVKLIWICRRAPTLNWSN
jgi:hypothetical protein